MVLMRTYVHDEDNPTANGEYEVTIDNLSELGYSIDDFPEVDDILIRMTPEEFEVFMAQFRNNDEE